MLWCWRIRCSLSSPVRPLRVVLHPLNAIYVISTIISIQFRRSPSFSGLVSHSFTQLSRLRFTLHFMGIISLTHVLSLSFLAAINTNGLWAYAEKCWWIWPHTWGGEQGLCKSYPFVSSLLLFKSMSSAGGLTCMTSYFSSELDCNLRAWILSLCKGCIPAHLTEYRQVSHKCCSSFWGTLYTDLLIMQNLDLK